MLESNYDLYATSAYQITLAGSVVKKIILPVYNGDIGGLTYLNNILWYGNPVSSNLYKIDPNGNTCMPIPEGVYFDQLEWDGYYFWGMGLYGHEITKFDANGNVVFSIDCDMRVISITWDGSSMWTLSESYSFDDFFLTKLDNQGVTIETIELYRSMVDDQSTMNPYAVVYMAGAFYVMSQSAFESNLMIYKYDID